MRTRAKSCKDQRSVYQYMQKSFVEGLSLKTLNSLYHASDPYHPQSRMEYLRNKESV